MRVDVKLSRSRVAKDSSFSSEIAEAVDRLPANDAGDHYVEVGLMPRAGEVLQLQSLQLQVELVIVYTSSVNSDSVGVVFVSDATEQTEIIQFGEPIKGA